jgi:hypothetical protein
MTAVRVELGNPGTYGSPTEYIEQHLMPAVTELHRITNELLDPGSTSPEDHAADMVPGEKSKSYYRRLDKPLHHSAKHVAFDGSEYFKIDPELLRSKQLKVQLTAVVYVLGTEAEFRLVRDDGAIILGSLIQSYKRTPETLSVILPFGNEDGCVSPDARVYYLEGGSLGRNIPVCRRFSMSFIYL